MEDKNINNSEILDNPKGPDSEIDDVDAELEVEEAETEAVEDGEVEPAAVPMEIVPIEDFEALGLDERLLAAVQKVGWKKPTPVQGLCLPISIKGRDVAGFAQTGTGKTGVFLLTVAQRVLTAPERKSNNPLAIVLAPTRELALQIEQDATGLLEGLPIRTLAVFGGMDYEKQAKAIRQGVDFIVATPGRLKDYLQKKEFSLDDCAIFVCDEADRMLDMGFIEDVEFFLDKLPEKCQRLLFSATTNETVKELAFEYLEKPEYISVNPETITPENIEQQAIALGSAHKLRVLLGLFRDLQPKCAIIFTNTKLVAEWLHFKLVNNGVPADIITGDLPQRKRIQLIKKIKQGEIKALVATDVASRGLHISDVTHVFNFDLPDDPSNYVHRIGRTARAGAKGISISFVCDDYGENLVPINELLGPALALKTTWFDPKYLEISDKAANPYARMSEKRHGDGEHRPGGRHRDRPDQRERGGRPTNQRDDGRHAGKQRHDGHRGHQKHGGKDQRPHHKGGRRHEGQRDHRPDQRHSQHGQHRSQVQALAPVQQKGVLALIKRIFRTIFGRK